MDALRNNIFQNPILIMNARNSISDRLGDIGGRHELAAGQVGLGFSLDLFSV